MKNPELKTIDWILIPLIPKINLNIPLWTLLISASSDLLNALLDIATGFRPMRVLTLNGAQNLKFPRFWLAIRNSAQAILIGSILDTS